LHMLTRLTEHRVLKPWGRSDVPPEFGKTDNEERLGEIWFQRDGLATDPLLVKYLFTSENLSIQVHPNDADARGHGKERGKDEAWLILDADPGARIGIGLREPLGPEELRASALDGSIVDLMDWRDARTGDAYYSPAGTLHSIGSGLVLLEVQQNSDTTYRLYDFGRRRDLHLDQGVNATNTGTKVSKAEEIALENGRTRLVGGSKFTIERLQLNGKMQLHASVSAPLWLIPMSGQIFAGNERLERPSVWIAEAVISLRMDPKAELLVAYEGESIRELGLD